MGVDTRLPDESDAGVEYPRYDELSDRWPRNDRAFVPKEIFDQMAKGIIKRTSCKLYHLYKILNYTHLELRVYVGVGAGCVPPLPLSPSLVLVLSQAPVSIP